MSEKLSWRWTVVLAVTILGGLWISPNFIDFKKDSMFGRNKMTLGLDIQGGLHLVMGVDVKEVVRERVARMANNLESDFREDGLGVQSVQVVGEDKTHLNVILANSEAKVAVEKVLTDSYSSLLQIISSSNEKIELRYFDARMLDMKKEVVNQAIEVLRNRIDEFGVAEPSIIAQGTDRILVQLPGILDKDVNRAKDLINRTAKLDFRIVSSEPPADDLQSWIAEAEKNGKYKLGENGLTYQAYIKRLNEDLQAKLPKNTRVVFEKAESAENLEAGRAPFTVKTDDALGGNLLEDASVNFDEFGKPEVNFRFGVEGRKKFAELTSKAAGGFLAIVLDDVVKSAPRVEREIDSESARITLGQTRDYNASLNEANFIATALRAGALPAALEQLEERTVGPSLGSDSVEKAKFASIIGTLVVLLLLAFRYRTAGLVADIALMMNFLLTFAILTSLGATLTLPGVAGLALTVGMSVDANIVIFERIKEELEKGASQVAALRDGFANSYSAVFDSNITAILTCIVLMYYGTGPIRGFAITLMTGIICSMFTAVFVSRTILDTLVIKLKLNALPAQQKV